MAVDIDIAESYQAFVSAERLQAAVNAALAHEAAVGDITLVITDDDEIAELNQRFLGHAGPTDVLSFPAMDADTAGFALPPDFGPYLGDIVIAYPFAARQAQARGATIADELDLLVVHGVLHLLGYDHADAGEEATMWASQDAILAALRQA